MNIDSKSFARNSRWISPPSTPLAVGRRLLVAAVSAALLAGTVSAAEPTSVAPGAKVTAPPALVAERVVSIDANGAIYLTRDHDVLHVWVVNEIDGTVERKVSTALDPAMVETVAIELGARTTGLFYADNIVQPGDAFRLSFRGQVDQGNIVLPLPAKALDPLWAISDPDQVVTITAGQVELQALLLTQRAIYQRVSDVGLLHDEHVDQFRGDMQAELTHYYDLLTSESPIGNSHIDNAAASAQDAHDRFVAQAAGDEGTALAVAADAEQFGSAQTLRFERSVLGCISAETVKIEREMSALGQTIEALPEDEALNERMEATIATIDAGTARKQQAIENCANTAEIERYNPIVTVEENGAGYGPVNAVAQSLNASTETAVAAWAQSVEDRGAEQGARVEANPVPAAMTEYQSYFAEWLSPIYADEGDPIDVPPMDKSLAESLLETNQSKGLAQLCDSETWNVEFTIGGFSVVFATPWNDRVVTGNNHNLIFTFRGDDCIESHAGYDAVFAGPGRDRVFGGDDHDFLFGGRDSDEIHGSAGNTYTVTIGAVTLAFDIGNLIIGQAGSDNIFGGEVAADRGEDLLVDSHGYTDLILGDSFLFGGTAGNDAVQGEMGVDFIFGQDGNDTLSNVVPGVITINGLPVPFGTFFFGNPGNDTIIGSNTTIAGVFPLMGDFIFGNPGDDMVMANAGTDFVFGNDGNDNLNGGRDTDFAFGNFGQDSVTGNDGSDLVSGDLGDDMVFGSPGLFDLVLGGQGNDRLFGNDGVDLIFGSQGSDTIQGNDAFDMIFAGSEADIANGNDGIDLIFGGEGEDQLGGDNGIDLIFGNRHSDTVHGGNDFDVIFGNENSDKPETLFGDAGTDLIFGNEGNDRIYGNDGTDLLFGNRGRDEINGNNGIDVAFGNDDVDIVRGDDGVDLLFGNEGNDDVGGGNGIDVAFGNDGCDLVSGNADADLLFGNDGKDRIWGGDGLDIAFGNAGTDYMRGENGSDFLFGNDDNDSLGGDDALDMTSGGSGDDYMTGGSGSDIMLGSTGSDFARGDDGVDFAFGGDNNDTLDGANDADFQFGNDGDDNINSGSGSDFSFGNSGADRLRAVEGTNFAFGNSGNDTVDGYYSSGWDARDYLFGNSDNDTITGNQNNQKDLRFGGSGSDNKYWNTTYVSASLFNGSWNGNSNCQ